MHDMMGERDCYMVGANLGICIEHVSLRLMKLNKTSAHVCLIYYEC
jgi:hypothetical protein